MLGGWASGSPYPLLAALRSAAQVISYEIALGLSVVAVILYAGSLSTADIVAAQASGWFGWLLIPSFAVFVIAMVGETNRAPFDLPEAESELVGGFHTEYSSLKFALFFLAEYVNMVTVSAMATTLFLGGGQWPWPLSFLNGNGWLQFVAFLMKTFIFLFVFIWLRGTLPRFRYDQFMRLGWKALVPLSLLWILVVFALRTYRSVGSGDVTVVLLTLGIVRRRACWWWRSWSRTGSGPRRRRSSWLRTTRCPRWTSRFPTRLGRAGARSTRRRQRRPPPPDRGRRRGASCAVHPRTGRAE